MKHLATVSLVVISLTLVSVLGGPRQLANTETDSVGAGLVPARTSAAVAAGQGHALPLQEIRGDAGNLPTSCRSRTDVVGECLSVHGRLSVYNGTPSIRLWPIGTKRLLGIIDPKDPSNAPGPTVLPIDIKSKLDGDTNVFGDFLVCPLTRARAGRMQTVCIESAKNLVTRKHELRER